MLFRRSRVLVAGSIVVSSVFAFGACGGDDLEQATSDAGSSDATSFDVNVDSQADAKGATDSSIRDAATTEGDAASDAGPPGLITLHIAAWDDRELVPYDSAIVVFYDPDGTPHAPIISEDGGTTTATILPHSSVTVSMPDHRISYPDGVDLITYLDIGPGEELTVAGYQQSQPPPVTMVGDTSAALPGGDAGVFQTAAGNGCSTIDSFEAVHLLTFDRCIFGDHVSVLARGTADRKIFSYAEATVPFVDAGATVTSDDWSWTPATQDTFSVTDGVLPEGTDVYVLVALRKGTLAYLDDNDGLTYDALFTDGGVFPPITVPLPGPGFIDNVSYSAMLNKRRVLATNALADGVSISATELPPTIDDAGVAYDATARTATVSFTSDAPMTNVNGVIAVAAWSKGLSGYSWQIVAPPAVTVVTPPLTTELVGGDFPTASNGLTFNSVTLESVSTAATYADFLAQVASYDPRWLFHEHLSATPVRVRLSKTP